jgi:DNA-binding NarL/FixJ family response regulator
MAQKMIRVVIVDDHPIVRAGMRAVLESASDVSVVAEGASGADALRLVSEHQPDALVLDVNLPDLNGVEVTRRLHGQKVATAILILTIHNDSETVFGLLEAGAIGYVLKDDALETLAAAVRAAARGENWLSPKVTQQVMRRTIGEADDRPSPPSTLTQSLAREFLKRHARTFDARSVSTRSGSSSGPLTHRARFACALLVARHHGRRAHTFFARVAVITARARVLTNCNSV